MSTNELLRRRSVFFVAFRPAQCQTFRYAFHTRLPPAFFWPPFDLAPLPKTLLHRPCRPCLGAFGLVEQFQSIQFSIPTISRSSTASRIVEPQQRQPATIHCASAGYSAKANDPRAPIPTANFPARMGRWNQRRRYPNLAHSKQTTSQNPPARH